MCAEPFDEHNAASVINGCHQAVVTPFNLLTKPSVNPILFLDRTVLDSAMAAKKRNKRISKKEFVKRFTDLTIRHFSKLPPEKQDAQLEALERRVSTISRDTHPTLSRTPETPAIRLSARSPHEEA